MGGTTLAYLDTIMAGDVGELRNRVREARQARGWSQDELARRSGLSRAGVGAVETGRLVPSTAAALAIAAAFGARVEELFSLAGFETAAATWAWEPAAGGASRYWRAEVGGRVRLYPVEPLSLGSIAHDGTASAPESPHDSPEGFDPARTLIMACCDPAVGLLAEALARAVGVRLIPLTRPSRAALDLLKRGLVHVAGVHLAGTTGKDDGNATAVREALGPGQVLLRNARWVEGIAFGAGRNLRTTGEAAKAGLRWVGREPGSGARECLDTLLGTAKPPRRLARDHRGVAEAIRAGWADAGVCLRLAGEEAGLAFLPVREESYDLCFAQGSSDDPRVRALVAAVRSSGYRRLLGELPGYDSRATGETRAV